jgi:hypothetical protein
MLLQSHREGLYVWDADEGQHGDAPAAGGADGGAQGATAAAGAANAAHGRPSVPQPMWWEVPLAGCGSGGAGAGGSQGCRPVLAAPWPEGCSGVAPPDDEDGPRGGGPAPWAGAGGAAGPDLRMVAYLHYEQLLEALEGRLALPQVRAGPKGGKRAARCEYLQPSRARYGLWQAADTRRLAFPLPPPDLSSDATAGAAAVSCSPIGP